jgi:hypothetical protein
MTPLNGYPGLRSRYRFGERNRELKFQVLSTLGIPSSRTTRKEL